MSNPLTIEPACLQHVFNIVIKWGKAQKNPVKEVKFFKEPEGKVRILSPKEEVRLFDAIRASKKGKHLEPIVITALLTGMRKSEILALKWTNIDFNNRIFTVEGTKSGYNHKIPMSPKLKETLDNIRKKSHSDFVFSDEKGKPYKSFSI